MVTIKQIAEACGVSIATVSKALNGASDIGSATAERIKHKASELGYIPNAAAVALKTSRSFNFGILFDDGMNHGLTHEFFARVINAFKDRAEELGYDITFISEKLGSRNIGVAEHVYYRNLDGLAIITTVSPIPEVANEIIHQHHIPVVCIDHQYDQCSGIYSDNKQGMRSLVSYIISKGHRKVAFIHGDLTSVTRLRLQAMKEVFEESNVPFPTEYIVEGRYHDPATTAERTKELLALPDPPTCILFPDDYAYIGGMNEIERHGFKIPEDVSVAGFDGIAMSQAMRPRLCTLRQDCEALGVKAAEELARAVEQGASYKPVTLMVQGHLIHGETIQSLSPT